MFNSLVLIKLLWIKVSWNVNTDNISDCYSNTLVNFEGVQFSQYIFQKDNIKSLDIFHSISEYRLSDELKSVS